MKIVDAGHNYEIDGYDGGQPQHIQFMKREGEGFPFNVGHYGGTNCQEVLRVLIDRSEYLQRQKPCAETEAIIAALKTALFLFESRAARIHGNKLDLQDLSALIRETPDPETGHIRRHD